jgi:hypothetical protein
MMANTPEGVERMDENEVDGLVEEAQTRNVAWLKELSEKMAKEAEEFGKKTGLDLTDTLAPDGSDFAGMLMDASEDCSNVPELLLYLAERIQMRSC